ncbi:cell division protein FtsB [Proteobacteria bacterium 005FR1]|nr:cell division protein FtsB [Proteobacteria bacterium 005FR1]
MKWLIAALVVCLFFLQYRLWIGEGSLAEVVQLQREIAEQQTEIERLQERNRILALEVRELKTGLDTLEERARSEMGMIKEGETFYLVIEPEQAAKRPAAKPADRENQ